MNATSGENIAVMKHNAAIRRLSWRLLSSASLLTACGLASPALGQTPPQEAVDADQDSYENVIIVTGSPVRQQVFITPADIDVLEGDTKERAESAGLGQTLDALPGITNLSTGEQVGVPVIRGLTGTRIRVMYNDVGLYYQQYGVRHPVNIDPFLADRFEIVRGPASLQYGSDAIGGALNIFPHPIPESEDGGAEISGAVRVGYSSAYDSLDTGIRANLAVGNFGLTAAWVQRDSGGMTTPDAPEFMPGGKADLPLVTGDIPFTDYEQANGSFGAGYHGDGWTLSLRHERYKSRQNTLLPDPQGGALPELGGIGQELTNETSQALLEIDLPLGELDSSVTFYQNVRLANQGGADPVPLPLVTPLDIDLRRESLTMRSVLHHDPIFGLAGQVGIEVSTEDQFSNGITRLSPGADIENFAAFLFEEARIGDLIVDFGARYDRREQNLRLDRTFDLQGLPTDPATFERTYENLTWGVGLSYRLSTDLVATANLRTGFRAPDLFELYTNGVHGGVAAVQLGDPDLVPEEALSGDASLRWSSDRARGSITGYVTDFDGYITLLGTGQTNPLNGLPIFQVAQRDARVWGFDVDAVVEPLAGLELHGTFELVRGTFTNSADKVPLLPADNVIAEATYRFAEMGDIRSAYALVSVRHTFAKDSAGAIEPFSQYDGAGFGTASTRDYTLVHLGAGLDLGRVSFRFEIENLFDVAYRDFLDTYKIITLGAGRDFRLSAMLRF